MQTLQEDKPITLRDRLIYRDGRWLEPVPGGFRIISSEFVDMTREELKEEFLTSLSDPDFARPLYQAYDVVIQAARKGKTKTQELQPVCS